MLVQTLYILQILALGAIPLVKGQTDYGPPEDTNPKNPRQLFPKLWFYTGKLSEIRRQARVTHILVTPADLLDATCTETPSEPEILGIGDHGTDDGKCQGLNNRMSVGIEQDPEGAEVEFNNGCLLMFEKKGCKGEGVPIDLRYQGQSNLTHILRLQSLILGA